MKEIYEIVKNRYITMEKHGLVLGDSNIMGHVVCEFCSAQDENKDKFFDTYDNVYGADQECISSCDILVNRKSIMSILAVPLETDEETCMQWLRNYMTQTKVIIGIVIKGTEWKMIDDDGKEYCIDFANPNADIDVFDKFAILK